METIPWLHAGVQPDGGVGGCQNRNAVLFERPLDFGQVCVAINDMFDDLKAYHDVELVRLKRKLGAVGDPEFNVVAAVLSDCLLNGRLGESTPPVVLAEDSARIFVPYPSLHPTSRTDLFFANRAAIV
jgi:hypothetical protein